LAANCHSLRGRLNSRSTDPVSALTYRSHI
jgi:hypothetical protein